MTEQARLLLEIVNYKEFPPPGGLPYEISVPLARGRSACAVV